MRLEENNCLQFVIDTCNQQKNGIIVFDNVGRWLLLELLKQLKPNVICSEFPDFISSEVVVEHFTITSSKENKKGSSFKIESRINNKTLDEIIAKWEDNCRRSPFESGTMRIKK